MSSYKKFLSLFFIGVLFSIVIALSIGGLFVYRHVQRRTAAFNAGGPFFICYVAGGSGGHIIPALTLARQYTEEVPRARVLFFSLAMPLDQAIVKKASHVTVYETINLGNLPRHSLTAWPGYLVDVVRTVWRTWKTMWHLQPAKVVSMGGYVSVPVCLVAWVLRIPIELYELNVVPGSAVKFLSRFATVTTTCFDETRKYLPPSAYVVRGRYPVRFKQIDRLDRADACKRLGITPDHSIILVLGGSKGSHVINEIVPKAVSGLKRSGFKPFVLHQTGGGATLSQEEIALTQKAYKDLGVDAQVFLFRDDMQVLYSAADVAVARAGAGTLFELDFFDKKAIIIPLETDVTAHQFDNALAMGQRYPDRIKVLKQDTVVQHPELLRDQLTSILSHS